MIHCFHFPNVLVCIHKGQTQTVQKLQEQKSAWLEMSFDHLVRQLTGEKITQLLVTHLVTGRQVLCVPMIVLIRRAHQRTLEAGAYEIYQTILSKKTAGSDEIRHVPGFSPDAHYVLIPVHRSLKREEKHRIPSNDALNGQTLAHLIETAQSSSPHRPNEEHRGGQHSGVQYNQTKQGYALSS